MALDNGDSFILSSLTAARLGLEEGQELSEEAYDEILKSLRKSCMQKCGSLLGTRDYSEQRLREKLQTHNDAKKNRHSGCGSFSCILIMSACLQSDARQLFQRGPASHHFAFITFCHSGEYPP